jgi:hypothetical protein
MHVGWRRKGEGLGIEYLGLGKLWCVGVDSRSLKGRMVLSVISFCPSTSGIGFTAILLLSHPYIRTSARSV